MATIYKYPLEVKGEQSIMLPIGAEVLSVSEQHGGIVLYALVNPEFTGADMRAHAIRVHGTGHPIEDSLLSSFDFLGTVNLAGGSLMFHVFIRKPTIGEVLLGTMTRQEGTGQ